MAGPSGVGKGTIVRRLLERDPLLWYSVSATTRAPRPGEVAGRDYDFVDRATFEALRDAGGMLEWFEVYGDLKGTPRAPVEDHLARSDVLLEVDVQGALAVKQIFPEAVLVFVAAPSPEVQRARLRDRGTDEPDTVARRLAEAEAEAAFAPRFDHVVVNDDLDSVVGEVAGILEDSRHR